MASTSNLRQQTQNASGPIWGTDVFCVRTDTQSFSALVGTVKSLASLHGSSGAHSAMDPLMGDRDLPQSCVSLIRAPGEGRLP